MAVDVATILAPRSRSQRVRPLLIGAGVTAAATLALHFRDPHASGSYGGCPWLFLTGTYCPGCGGLRAVNELTNGDLAAAFSSNPLFIVLIPVALTLWFIALRRAWVGAPRTRRQEQVHTRLTWAFGLVVLVFWVARNLPAFAWMAPN
jgi:hypothetical protein